MLLKSAGNARGFEAKVTDFGAARRLAAADRLATNSNDTITHCSPELLLHSTVSEARPASRAAAPPPSSTPLRLPRRGRTQNESLIRMRNWTRGSQTLQQAVSPSPARVCCGAIAVRCPASPACTPACLKRSSMRRHLWTASQLRPGAITSHVPAFIEKASDEL